MERVGYLGPDGSYSKIAADLLRPNARHREYATFKAVMNALLSGECDSVVLPIENSLNGGVSQNIDILQNTEKVLAVEECVLKIDHRLAYLTGTKLGDIKRVYSHEQALAQCGEFLFKNLPNAELIAVPSTAASLKMIKSTSDAGIVGVQLKKDGIELSDCSISDEPYNFTHFLYIIKGEADEHRKSKRIYFSVTCKHEHGALLSILKPIADGGINMTKIESRPIKEKTGEYRFFIEIEGDYSSKAARQVLAEVSKRASSLKILGTYL